MNPTQVNLYNGRMGHFDCNYFISISMNHIYYTSISIVKNKILNYINYTIYLPTREQLYRLTTTHLQKQKQNITKNITADVANKLLNLLTSEQYKLIKQKDIQKFTCHSLRIRASMYSLHEVIQKNSSSVYFNTSNG